MIVTDLDGTLLAGKSNLPEENIRALRRAMDAGVRVVIASGRMVEATLPIAEKIGVNAPMIVFNGAQICDPKSREALFGRRIPAETARKILAALEEADIHTHAFPSHGYFMEKRDAWSEYYEDKIGVVGTAVEEKLSLWLKEDVYKLLSLAEADVLNRAQRVLSERFPEVTFVKSGENHLEIVPRGIDKATGLRFLSPYLGVTPDEMLSFGDEMNDLPLLEFAGTGYAMDNCVPGVRRRVRHIAPKNTDCGVARIVNMYLDEGRMGDGRR